MKSIKIATGLSIAMFFVFTTFCLAQTASSQKTGRVKGLITDEAGSRIATAEITIENQSYHSQIKVDEAGEFELALPQGSYEIRISANGFCSFRYKEIIVKPDDVLTLNLTLKVRRPSPAGCLNRDIFKLSGVTEEADYIGISYIEMTQGYHTREYRGGFSPSVGDIDLRATYRGIDLTADKIILNTQTFDLVATGNVVVIDGKKKQSVNEINLKWGKEIKRLDRVILE
jgi:hypothetical protein